MKVQINSHGGEKENMKSMTGFGRANLAKGERQYIVEIKSVNHKYNDVTVKLPRNLLFLEDKIRKCVLNKVARGKIDLYITYSNYGSEGRKIIINQTLAKQYIEELRTLAVENNISAQIEVTEISTFPEVMNIEENEDQEMIAEELLQCVHMALEEFIAMREQEGEKLREDFAKRIECVEGNVQKILQCSTGLIEEYVVKLKKRINEMLPTEEIDQNRLAQEIVIYADKCSTEEELTRLESHIAQFKKLLDASEPIGKKMDFLIQEMNREVNTIGSKSGSLEITNYVIELKTQIEDIREQIQNIE